MHSLARAAIPRWIFPVILCLGVSSQAAEPYSPIVASASDEAQQQISGFAVPEGFKVDVAAAEPELANPVAFCFDEHGRVLVCETYRPNNAVLDNRGHMQWLDDDLAAQTVDDRAAYIQKHFPDYATRFTEHHDLLRLLEDRDHDGRFETSRVFADGFNDILDGIGSGVLARNGDVYYTCIPSLWKMRDTHGTGQADERVSLHRGYGVRWAFFGHDMHGLCIGPDGKLYYSIGDRGLSVTTGGKTISMPDRGAVLRCNFDGSELEVYASGLRNPQELAFDQYGNLFTGDNNSDSGDSARWVFLVEGADSGWRMYYQYPGDRGPWNREKLWEPQFSGQAAYIVPPIAHIPSGPSGLTFAPGVGLPDEFTGQFLLCDFHGASIGSGVNAIATKPRGASFEVNNIKPFVQNVLATDVAIGPDSAVYVSDWVHGWQGPGKGRIYRIWRPGLKEDPLRVETQSLLTTDLKGKSVEELSSLLGHADMRVRLNTQFALVDKGEPAIGAFVATLQQSTKQLARIHALWGLGQLRRTLPQALKSVVGVLTDSDAEVRAQSAKVLGDGRFAGALNPLIRALSDESPRVRYLAAQSLGKLQAREARLPLVELLRSNRDEDVIVRHATARALASSADAKTLSDLANDSSSSVRLGAVLALRQLQSQELAKFLGDADARVSLEAARAIHDLPIADAYTDLATIIDRPYAGDDLQRDALWRRALNAHFRLGAATNAQAVAQFATRKDVSGPLKSEAMQMLSDWTTPSNRDRVLGDWRPLEPRDADIATETIRGMLPQFFAAEDEVGQLALQLAARVGIHEVAPLLLKSVRDSSRPDQESADSLVSLEGLHDPQLTVAVDAALADARPRVCAAALGVLVRTRPEDALPSLQKAVLEGSLHEQKVAVAALGELPEGEADSLVCRAFERLNAGQLPAEVQLELLTAAAARKDPLVTEALNKFEAARKLDDPIAQYREALAGGDAENGRKLFLQKSEASCVRCHRVQGIGGNVGPDLSKIGVDKTREHLLQSIVAPNLAIAKGFESVMLVLDSGKIVSGVLREENEAQIRLVTAEGESLTVSKDSIEDRATGKSAMPEDVAKKISKSDLRDLVEFLTSLTKEVEAH